MNYANSTTVLFNNQVEILNAKPAHLETGLNLAEMFSFPVTAGASVKLGFYRSKNTTEPIRFVNWSDLLKLAENPSVGPKDDAGCLSQHDGNGKTADESRSAKFGIVAIDYDNGLKSFSEVCRQWGGLDVNFLAFTTASHTEKHQKFKVLLPLKQSVTAEEWAPVARGLAMLVGADPAQARPAQVFFAPNKLTADSLYEHFHETGCADFDSSNPLWNQAVTAFEESRQTAEVKSSVRPREISANQANIIQLINSAYDIGMLLESHGYTRKGRKWLSPFSESGTPGISILNRDGKVVLYSHHGPADPLSAENHSGHALDVAGVLYCLRYTHDFGRMIRVEADRLDPQGQRDRQREYMTAQANDEALAGLGGDFDLSRFSLTGQSSKMKLQMLAAQFILGSLAILGQWTIFFAKPNAGKTLITLRLLIDAVKSGQIKGKDVFYINADDNYRGLVEKLELVEPYGIEMLAPGHFGFDGRMILAILDKISDAGAARGKIIVLDTMKKFTDLMDKRAASDFGKVIRKFVLNGGSLIMLAHTNKHRDGDGKVVFAGTSDSVDDADCAYTLDVVKDQPDGTRVVMFENFKARGDVAMKASYQYSTLRGQSYETVLNSVEPITESDLKQVTEQAKRDELFSRNAELIDIITALIAEGCVKKTELIREAQERSGESRNTVKRVLREHEGEDRSQGHYWHEGRGEGAAIVYKLTEFSTGTDEDKF